MAQTKPTEKSTSTAAAPGKQSDPPAATAETPKRTRLSVSKDKKLAYLVLSLVSILETAKIAAALDEPQKAKVTAAKATANDIGGGDVLKPITDRILAIQKELKALDFSKPETINQTAAQAKELANELCRVSLG